MAYCGPRGIELDAFLRWSQKSQDAALDWASYEGRRCASCGTHPDEWENAESFHAHPAQCKGCQAQQRVSESMKDSPERGLYVMTVQGSAAVCPLCMPQDDDD
ncbi:MAG: hypothetical protein JWO98_4739 [Frankiales bacterium]|nr:hypothetical protein [Frankiales bacterium]